MNTEITPTQHECLEWARMAQDAYRTGRNFYGHRYSGMAAKNQTPMDIKVFDTLQRDYGTWLVVCWKGIENPA